MKKKDEALKHFAHYKAWAENFHHPAGHRIQNFRTDNGGEFLSNAFSDFLRQSGIQRQLSTAYTPQQNGVAERSMRTINDATTTMLQAAGLPKSFWGEAAATAVYTRNRCPSQAVKGKTPFEAWSGEKPTVGHLRQFGCLAYAHVPSETRVKFDAKSQRCIFVGYSDDHKAYRLWSPAKHKVIISRDVTFVEHQLGVHKSDGDGGRGALSDLSITSSPAYQSGATSRRQSTHRSSLMLDHQPMHRLTPPDQREMSRTNQLPLHLASSRCLERPRCLER
jgi:hypothetical protein